MSEGFALQIKGRILDLEMEEEELFFEVSGTATYNGRHLRPSMSLNNYLVIEDYGRLYLDGFEGDTVDISNGTAAPKFALDPSGNYIHRSNGIYGIEKSSDQGQTWETALTPPYSAWTKMVFISLASSSRWVVQFLDGPAGTFRLMYTDDFGETWTEKTTEFAAAAGVHAEITLMRYLP
jgi:hypothetical protein